MSAGTGKGALSAVRRVAILRARIFGDVVRSTSESDMRVLHMFTRRPWAHELTAWYPPNHGSLLLKLQTLGLYRDEHNEFSEQMAIQRKARGKGPPKKGEGKQKKAKKKR